jgi:hypothetical protein
MRRFFLAIATALIIAASALSAQAQSPQPRTIEGWLKAQAEHAPAANDRAMAGETSDQERMAAGLDTTREFLRDLVAAIPRLPSEFGRVSTFANDFRERGVLSLLFLLAAFVVLGCGLEWLLWWATASFPMQCLMLRSSSSS